MKESKKEIVEKLYGDLMSMEKDIKDLKEILKSKKDQSPKVEKMYDDLESTEKSVNNIKKTINNSNKVEE